MTSLWEAPLLGVGRRRGDVPLHIDDLEQIPSNAAYARRKAARNPMAQSAPVPVLYQHAHGKTSPYVVSKVSRSTRQTYDAPTRPILRQLDTRLTRAPFYSSGSMVPHIGVHKFGRYQDLDTLNRLWNTLHIPEGERVYAYRQIQRNRTLAQAYYKRLSLLHSYKRQYDEAMASRQEVLQDLSRFLVKMKGSRTDLTYCITRFRYLTFKISSIVNLARVLCRKPVTYPDLTLSVQDLSNWSLYLKQEAFYTRSTTAIIFTVLKFFGDRTFHEVQNIVNKYFDRCTKGKSYLEKCSVLQGNRDPDISYSCVSRRSHLNISCIAPLGPEQAVDVEVDSGTRISEDDVSLYLLLGLDAETIFNGDNLAVKWNDFLSKRNGAYYWEDDPTEMQRFGKHDWVPLLKPQNVRDMTILEPMIQDDVTKMLKLLSQNNEVPVTIPLRNDIEPFETYFVRPCNKKRILAKRHKGTYDRLSQPRNARKKHPVQPVKKRASSKPDTRAPRQVANSHGHSHGHTHSRPSSRAAVHKVQRQSRAPPTSIQTNSDYDAIHQSTSRSLSVLPGIGTPAKETPGTNLKSPDNVITPNKRPHPHPHPQPATSSVSKKPQQPTDVSSMLEVIEILMEIPHRLESPRDAHVYDKFIESQKRGLATTANTSIYKHGSEDTGAKQMVKKLSDSSVSAVTTSVMHITQGLQTPKSVHDPVARLESPVSSGYPVHVDNMWNLLNSRLQAIRDAESSVVAVTPGFRSLKNVLSRSVAMESVTDLPKSFLSPQSIIMVPHVVAYGSTLNVSQLTCGSQAHDHSHDSPCFSNLNLMSERSVICNIPGNQNIMDSLTASRKLGSSILASFKSNSILASPPRNEYIITPVMYLAPVIDMSVSSDALENVQMEPKSPSMPSSAVSSPTSTIPIMQTSEIISLSSPLSPSTVKSVSRLKSESGSPLSPLLPLPVQRERPKCITALHEKRNPEITITLNESTLYAHDSDNMSKTNLIHDLGTETVSTSHDTPALTPLERYGVPVMDFNKISYKLDEVAFQRQPMLIKYREKFRFLHKEDRSSSDYDYVGGEFVRVTRMPGGHSDSDDLLEYKDHYFDKPFISKKFRKLERKRALLKRVEETAKAKKKSMAGAPAKPKRMKEAIEVKPHVLSAPAKKGLAGIPQGPTQFLSPTKAKQENRDNKKVDENTPVEVHMDSTSDEHDNGERAIFKEMMKAAEQSQQSQQSQQSRRGSAGGIHVSSEHATSQTEEVLEHTDLLVTLATSRRQTSGHGLLALGSADNIPTASSEILNQELNNRTKIARMSDAPIPQHLEGDEVTALASAAEIEALGEMASKITSNPKSSLSSCFNTSYTSLCDTSQ